MQRRRIPTSRRASASPMCTNFGTWRAAQRAAPCERGASMRHRWSIGVVAVLAAAAVSGTAAARPLDGGEFHDEFNFLEEDFCEVDGLTVEINVVVDGSFTARTHGTDLVYFAEHL